jgi:tRNA threonylcarbamoyladenosine biosynthesis protein TsaE
MFISNSAVETIAAGISAARDARAGDVFALSGEVGAGKTHFVKGFVAGVESSSEVTSPTFTVVHEYEGGRLPVYHFDFYRMETADELLRLGFDDYIYGHGVCLVEWADRFREILPEQTSWISFTICSETARGIDGLNVS